MLNIKPKTHQTKRAMPRSVLRAVKANKKDESTDIQQSKMKAYRDALQMLDKIKETVDGQVMINGSSLKDRLETHSPEFTQIDEEKRDTLETRNNDDLNQNLTDRSQK